MKIKRSTKIIATISTVVWLLSSAFVIYAMAQNNNQGEIYDPITGVWDWPYVLTLVGIMWLWTALPLFLFLYILNWLGGEDLRITP